MTILNQSIKTMQNCVICTQIHIKTQDFDEDIADDVKKRFDTSNYCANRSFPIGENKKKIGLMKDKLGGKITTLVCS